MTTEEKLQRALETCQRDILLALADEALERGEEVLSRGYRWLAENDKWPRWINIVKDGQPPAHRLVQGPQR